MMNYLNLVIKQGEGIVTTLEHIKYFFMHSSINQNKVFKYNKSNLGKYRKLGVKVEVNEKKESEEIEKNPLTQPIFHQFPNNAKDNDNEITEMRNVGEMEKYQILKMLSEYSGGNGELKLKKHLTETKDENPVEYVHIPVDKKAVFIMLALIKRGETEQGKNDYSSNEDNVKKFTSAAQETLELANILKSEPQDLDKAKIVFEGIKDKIIEESTINNLTEELDKGKILYGGRRKKTKRKERKRKRIAKKKSRKYSRNYLKKQKRNNKK